MSGLVFWVLGLVFWVLGLVFWVLTQQNRLTLLKRKHEEAQADKREPTRAVRQARIHDTVPGSS